MGKECGSSKSQSSLGNQRVSYGSLCDDCIEIQANICRPYDSGNATKAPRDLEFLEIRMPLANIEKCPMCAFLQAFIARYGLQFPDGTKIFLDEERNGTWGLWKWKLFGTYHFRYLEHHVYKPISLQSALQVKKVIEIEGNYFRCYRKNRVYPHLQTYQFIRKWFDECLQCHTDHCLNNISGLDFEGIDGFRFIDCESRQIVPASKALDKAYITLSYVWGTSSASTSGDDNELPSRLPKVVEDSIRVVKKLGFRYLWVDRYCIPQLDKKAKHAHIQLMGKIYASSAMTIIAAAGEDAEYGLPGVGSRARNAQLRIDFERHNDGHRVRHGRPLMVHYEPRNDVELSMWSTRGWTYQEALLSKRRLVFTDNQVFFQCQKMLYEESQTSLVPGEVPGSLSKYNCVVFPSPDDLEDTIHVWFRINEFLKRHLSFDCDALDAISGILDMYRTKRNQDLLGLDFFCGLPMFNAFSRHDQSIKFDKNCIFAGLAWTATWHKRPDCAPKAESSSRGFKRPRRGEFPSWTWVGWKCTSEYILEVKGARSAWPTSECATRAVYEDCEIDLDSEEDAREIIRRSASGLNPKYLDIKGLCFDVNIAWDSELRDWVYTEPLADCLHQVKPRVQGIPPYTLEVGEGKVHTLVALILSTEKEKDSDFQSQGNILIVDFLLLQPVGHNIGTRVLEGGGCASGVGVEESSGIQTRQVYERVTHAWVDMNASEEQLQKVEAGFEERELRLG